MILVTERAISALDGIADYLAEHAGAPLGERFLTSAFETFDVIERRPRIGTPHRARRARLKGLRRWPVDGFPNHLIFYRPIRGGIEIVDVIHAARDLLRALEIE